MIPSVLLLAGVGAAIYYATRPPQDAAGIKAGIDWGQPKPSAPELPGVIGSWVEKINDQVVAMSVPRGIRNNNPFNLRITSIPWRGKLPGYLNTDKAFEQFDTAANGIRAGLRDLWTDYSRDGQRTIRALITEFAPDSENNTAAYIRSVAEYVGKGPDQELAFPADMLRLARAMIAHENGAAYRDHYPDELIKTAIREATS